MTIDLQKQAIKEFELKDVKKLLEKLKTSDNLQLTEDLLKKLDKNDESLSETEKTLLEQSKESLNLLTFLKEIVKKLETRKKTDFIQIYEKSDFKQTLETSPINKLYENKKFLDYLMKQNSAIQGPIVGICRLTLGDGGKGEKLETYIGDLSKNIETPEQFAEKLEDINKFIKQTFLEQKKEDEKIKLDEKTKEILKSINPDFIKNNENINLSSIEISFNIFIANKSKELIKKGKKIDKNNIEKYIEDYLNTFGDINQKWKNKIINYLKLNNKSKIFDKLTQKVKNDKEGKIYKAFKKFAENKENEKNKSEIEEILKNIEKKEFEKNIKKGNNIQELNSINDKSIIDNSYNIAFNKLPSEITENNTITLKNGKKIDNISSKEYEILNINTETGTIGNPEALKNLIDAKEKLNKLGLDFVWENRNSIFKIIKNDSDFALNGININDNNLIDKREFNNLLQFILKIYGDKNPSNIESVNYARILQINEIGAISDKRDGFTGLSNIGQKFIEIGFFNSSGNVDIFGENKLRNYVKNGYKLINSNKEN